MINRIICFFNLKSNSIESMYKYWILYVFSFQNYKDKVAYILAGTIN